MARLGGDDPAHRRGGRLLARPAARSSPTPAAPARASEVMALRVGYDKLNAETGWKPTVSWEEGIRRTIAWYAANRERWVGRVDWMQSEASRQGRGGRSAADRDARARHRRCRLPRLVPRRAARGARRRGHRPAAGRVRPDPLGRRGAAVRGRAAGDRVPPRGRGRRHRRQPREPRPVLVREPDHGRARARALPAARRLEARRRRHGLRLPEVHADAVPRGRALERLSRGDERAVRRREEVGAGRRAGLPRAVRARHRLPPAGEPLRAARQLRPRRPRTSCRR